MNQNLPAQPLPPPEYTPRHAEVLIWLVTIAGSIGLLLCWGVEMGWLMARARLPLLLPLPMALVLLAAALYYERLFFCL